MIIFDSIFVDIANFKNFKHSEVEIYSLFFYFRRPMAMIKATNICKRDCNYIQIYFLQTEMCKQ